MDKKHADHEYASIRDSFISYVGKPSRVEPANKYYGEASIWYLKHYSMMLVTMYDDHDSENVGIVVYFTPYQ